MLAPNQSDGDTMKKSEKMIQKIKEEIPGFDIKFKDKSSGVYTAIFFLASLFNKRFMTNFTTVLGKTIWFPTKEFFEADDYRTFSILAHEYVHLLDKKKWGILFNISYLFPQILFLLSFISLFAFFDTNFLWFLVFSIFILPFPSIFRRIWEMRGYTITMYVDYITYNSSDSSIQNNILKNLTGWEYYKTSWSRNTIKEIILTNKDYCKNLKETSSWYVPELSVFRDINSISKS